MTQVDTPYVFNVESAKKLGRRPSYDVRNPLGDIPVTRMDSRGLIFPQELPDKPEDKTNLGRQPNMIASMSSIYIG